MKVAVAGTGYVGLSIATLDAKSAYKNADFVVIAAPANGIEKWNGAFEIELDALIDIK